MNFYNIDYYEKFMLESLVDIDHLQEGVGNTER
jgi:hypothetical protein